jgi:hypothetical protein
VSMKGVVLERETVVVLSLDGSLVYVEDVQPTHVAVVALPEQITAPGASCVFTPGRVGPKKISPYSRPDRIVPVADLSERNREFIAHFATWRQQHGPNYVHRTPEEQAKMTVIKAGPTPRSKKTPEEKKKRRLERKSNKVLCGKCGKPKAHGDHAFGQCTFEAPAATVTTTAATPKAPRASSSSGKYTVVNKDLSKVQAENDKFKPGNRFHRVFRALDEIGAPATLEDVIRAIATDGGRPMTNPEKVTRRALKQLTDAGNVARG